MSTILDIKGLTSHYGRIQALKGIDVTVEEGELTPSLKVKRKAVEEKYRDILDAMYS